MTPRGGSAGRRLGVAAALLVIARLAAAAETPAGAGDRGPLVSLWVQAGHGLPVEGARVRVFDHHGRPLVRRGRIVTPPSGALTVRLRRAAESFRVVVTGGRVDGVAMDARLESTVLRYREGRVVYVNPVTTLVARYTRRARVDAEAARHRIKRFLDIPAWASIGLHVRRGELHFSGAEFHRRALRRGGVRRYLQALVERAHTDTAATHVVRARAGGSAAAPPRDGAAGTPRAAGEGALAATLLDSLAGSVASEGFGWLLSLGGGDGTADALAQIEHLLAQIQAELHQIEVEITELERELAQTKYDVLSGQAATYVAFASEVEDRLAHLAALPIDGDPGRRAAVDALVAYIERNQDAARQLDLLLRGSGPGAEGILVAASQAVVAADRFFTSADSARVRGVFDFYATVQAVIATAVTEYQHARGFSTVLIEDSLQDVQASLAAQESGFVKAVLPFDTVLEGFHPITVKTYGLTIDTTTGLVWHGRASSLDWQHAKPLVTHPPGPVSMPSGLYTLPTTMQLGALTADLRGPNPFDALAAQTQIALAKTSSDAYVADNPPIPFCRFLFPSCSAARAPDCWWAYMDLRKGRVAWHPHPPPVVPEIICRDPRPATFVGTMLLVRPLRSDESYFFD